MRKLFILLSLFLGMVSACKKKASSSSSSGANTTPTTCPVNLGLFSKFPPVPANVPPEHMDQLALDRFSVSVGNGGEYFYISLTPKPIDEWSPMPEELKGRKADFPRVSICDGDNNCVALNRKNQVVAQPEGYLDFHQWSGTVAIPPSLSGTLSFTARACTYVRDENGNILSGQVHCAMNRVTHGFPASVFRPKTSFAAASNSITNYQIQSAIKNLVDQLLPSAQMFALSAAKNPPSAQGSQVLLQLAQIVAYDPGSLKGFLSSNMYSEFELEISNPGLELADSTPPCSSTLNTTTPVTTDTGVADNSTPPTNDSNGLLIPPPATPPTPTVTSTEIVTVNSTDYITETMVQTQVETQVSTQVASSYLAPIAYKAVKLRVLDARGNVSVCVQMNKSGLAVAPCADDPSFRWNFLVAANSTTPAQQINSVKDASVCLQQGANGLGLAICDAGNPNQWFVFSLSEMSSRAPILAGGGTSSAPYNWVGMQLGNPTNCVGSNGRSLTLTQMPSTKVSCSTAFSFDSISEPLTGMQKYATSLGAKANNALVGTIGTALTFGGIVIGIIGVGMFIQGSYAEDRAKHGNVPVVAGPKGGGVGGDGLIKPVVREVKVPETGEIRYIFNTPSSKIKGLAFSNELKDMEKKIAKEKGIPSITIDPQSLKLDAKGALVFIDEQGIGWDVPGGSHYTPKPNPISTTPKPTAIGNIFTTKHVGIAAAVGGLLTALAGSGMWVSSAVQLAATPEQTFANAVLQANHQFMALRKQLIATQPQP